MCKKQTKSRVSQTDKECWMLRNRRLLSNVFSNLINGIVWKKTKRFESKSQAKYTDDAKHIQTPATWIIMYFIFCLEVKIYINNQLHRQQMGAERQFEICCILFRSYLSQHCSCVRHCDGHSHNIEHSWQKNPRFYKLHNHYLIIIQANLKNMAPYQLLKYACQ